MKKNLVLIVSAVCAFVNFSSVAHARGHDEFDARGNLIMALVTSGIYSGENAVEYVGTLTEAEVGELLNSVQNESVLQVAGPVEFMGQ